MRAERHRRAGCRTQPGTVTMNMTTLFSQMFVLAILMGIGFLARRVQVMDAGFSRQLSDLLLHIAIPAMIIASVGKGDPFADISTCFMCWASVRWSMRSWFRWPRFACGC